MYKYTDTKDFSQLYSRFSKHQLFIYVLLELSISKHIPLDIIKYIYTIHKRQLKSDELSLRWFYHNHIAYQTLNCIDWPLVTDENIFRYRFPIGRHLEWSIKNYTSNLIYIYNDQVYYKPRTHVLKSFEIINSTYKGYSFLNEYSCYETKKSIQPLSLKKKIKFINNCNISEVYDDYIEWIRLIELTELTHNISTNQLLSHGLIVDRYCKDSIYIANEYDLLLYR